jgi:hypothetical protein
VAEFPGPVGDLCGLGGPTQRDGGDGLLDTAPRAGAGSVDPARGDGVDGDAAGGPQERDGFGGDVDGWRVTTSTGDDEIYDTILWATGFNVRLPFLDDSLLPWAAGAPVRYAGSIVAEPAEKLYFIGLIAPRGPQIPVYGMQAKLVAKMIKLHEQAGPGGAPIARYLASLQEPETGIDVLRDG